jgi:hypothetical protein
MQALKTAVSDPFHLSKYGRSDLQIYLALTWFSAIAGIVILYGESFVFFGDDGLSRAEWQFVTWGGFGINMFCVVMTFAAGLNKDNEKAAATKVVYKTAGLMWMACLFGAILYTIPEDHHRAADPELDARRIVLGQRAATANLVFLGLASMMVCAWMADFGEAIAKRAFNLAGCSKATICGV